MNYILFNYFFRLTDLHDQLISILAKHKSTSEVKQHVASSHYTDKKGSDASLRHHLPDLPRVESKPEEKVPTVSITGTVEPRAQLEGQIGPKRKRNPVIVTPAWSYNEVPSGILSSLNLFKVCTQYRFRRLQLQTYSQCHML